MDAFATTAKTADTATSAPLSSSWQALRHGEAASAVAASPPDYKRYHQAHAAALRDITGRRVLVVGCNRGIDCAYFMEVGAASCVGLDVMDEIGIEYEAAAVTYIKASAEAMPLEDKRFDLVFAYATLEHVPDIRSAFAEMVRVLAPGGFVYSAAAPLWHVRSGPHWGSAFDDDPWPHLRMSADEVAALGEARIRAGSTDPYHAPDRIRQHLTDPLLFNRRRPHEYVDACAVLDGIKIHRNAIDFEEQAGAPAPLVRDLVARGYTAFDLFGMTHMFVAERLHE